MYEVNYDDNRFKDVDTQKQQALNDVNTTYDTMINDANQYYQSQIDAVKDYETKQADIQNQNTQLAIDKLNQAQEKAEKEYTKEQSGAYVDWQKESNRYGANAEQLATSGLSNTGYSESTQRSLYNTYQNRVATAKASFNEAVVNYNNSIKEAQLANSSALAEIAYNSLQKQLELSLNGFQYKNALITDKLGQQQTINNTYYNRYQDVLAQINKENALAEEVRQYNEKMAYQKERDAVADAQWQKEYDLSKKASSTSRSSGSSGSVVSGALSNVSNSTGQGTIKATYTPSGLTTSEKQVFNSIGAVNSVDELTQKIARSGIGDTAAEKIYQAYGFNVKLTPSQSSLKSETKPVANVSTKPTLTSSLNNNKSTIANTLTSKASNISSSLKKLIGIK